MLSLFDRPLENGDSPDLHSLLYIVNAIFLFQYPQLALDNSTTPNTLVPSIRLYHADSDQYRLHKAPPPTPQVKPVDRDTRKHGNKLETLPRPRINIPIPSKRNVTTLESCAMFQYALESSQGTLGAGQRRMISTFPSPRSCGEPGKNICRPEKRFLPSIKNIFGPSKKSFPIQSNRIPVFFSDSNRDAFNN
jgi:hypothetical protein